MTSPGGSTTGRSLVLCTARSIDPASSASSISLTNRRLPAHRRHVSASAASLSAIARRADDHDLAGLADRLEPARHFPRLPQRQRAAAGADPERPSQNAHDPTNSRGPLPAGGGPGSSSSSSSLAIAEREQVAEGVRVRALQLLIGQRLELLGRRDQQLLDDQARDLVDAGPRLRRQPGDLRLQAIELGAADRLEALAQRDDGRHRRARARPRHEALDFLVDDRLGARRLAAAPGQALVDHRLQVVDVVEEDVVVAGDERIDVARQGDVDDEQRTPAAVPQRRLDARPGQDRRRSRRSR